MTQIITNNNNKFITAKLYERDQRHLRMGDTRYVLEPNIKEGKGALRDLHLIRWVVLASYRLKAVSELQHLGIFTSADARTYNKAIEFFWTLRFHLHYLEKRANEVLNFDAQLSLAQSMHYKDHPGLRGVERLMRHYFLHATNTAELTRILTTALQQELGLSTSGAGKISAKAKKAIATNPQAILSDARIDVSDSEILIKSPLVILQLFVLGLDYDLDFHPNFFRAIRKAFTSIRKLRHESQAYVLFLRILTAASGQERILRIMSECGFLERFLLDFGRIKAQMQYDMYHVYTTDEHCIRAVGNLNRIENRDSIEAHPLAVHEIHNITHRRVLYMALFLHDMAKGQGGDHSQLGARLALRLCPRFGFSEAESELVSWLILHHLLMSDTAFKRNLDDSKSIIDFVEVVGCMEHLRLLLCLTVADITAVGPHVWNNWKAHLIRVLYRRASAYMASSEGDVGVRDSEVALVEQRLVAINSDWDSDRLERFMGLAESGYYLAYTPEQLSAHANFMFAHDMEADKEGDKEARARICVDLQVDDEHSVTHLLVYARDSLGLAAQLCRAIALSSATIVEARLNVFSNGMVLDSFMVQDLHGRAVREYSDLYRLRNLLENATNVFNQALPMDLDQTSKTDPFFVSPYVDIRNDASDSTTMIEVRARDRLGLFFSLASVLAELGLRIGFARIATFGEEAHDVFYVYSQSGDKITDESELGVVREALLSVLR